MTTLISREKLSKKIWVKNSWKCWGFVKIEFFGQKFDFSNSVLEFKVWPQFLKNLGVLNSFQSSLVDEKLNLFSTHAKIRTQDADVEEGETKTIRINENLRYLLLAGGPKMWVFHIQAFVYALEFTSLILSSHKATRLTCEGQGWSSLILLTIIWKPFGYSEPWNLNHCPSNLVNLTIPFWLFSVLVWFNFAKNELLRDLSTEEIEKQLHLKRDITKNERTVKPFFH